MQSSDRLRNNKKDIDLSRTIRLSGLASGAKLELVQLSKSAGVVSVALQLPESEAQGLPNARLTDKFPSSTTLWLILRKFETGVAGNVASKRNLTARGVPSTDAGAGRLYYERPVVQIMGRELTSFTDLQKTLAQLGCNNGSILLRLSFKPSDTPLEEAMAEIEGYFHSVDGSDLERKDEAALGLSAPTERSLFRTIRCHGPSSRRLSYDPRAVKGTRTTGFRLAANGRHCSSNNIHRPAFISLPPAVQHGPHSCSNPTQSS